MIINTTGLSEIPLFQRPLAVTTISASRWASTYRIDVESERYFLKVSIGEQGREALKGEFEATYAIHATVKGFIPSPISFGSFKNLSDAHYYLCKYHELSPELPRSAEFCMILAQLHSDSVSPNGKFGFHVTTYNGNLPQDNTYFDTWEEFFIKGFKHMISLNITRGGPWDELQGLDTVMVEKVIPRLLRPMESHGRSIRPVLVHGDLWCGNVAVDTKTNSPLVYDPASFYAHNEYELGNWRPTRNKFTEAYFDAYHSHIPKTAPEEDYDDRNALYSLRFNLQAAAIFPETISFRELVLQEMTALVLKYPRGYEE